MLLNATHCQATYGIGCSPTANSSVTELVVTFCWSGVAVGGVLVDESEM